MLFMRFAIDCVFVAAPGDGDAGRRRVLSVNPSVKPWRGVVWRVAGAKGVLELPLGTIDATRTAVGDEITIEPA
jgi:uncharacterized membrane protein (UPF0127 family)